ncbi:hypothetical protein JB92DRAFT_3052553 [Gautieria morchelliformis]|nr:hypothetical protein JB92DRAFT_3052553 [Gautieria morchelliformis]
MTLAGWCAGSLVQAFLPPATFQLGQFVYCDNISFSVRGQNMRERIGPFMIACGLVEIFFERTSSVCLWLLLPHLSVSSLACISPHHSGKTEYWYNTF